MKIEVLYFDGCPNHRLTREQVKDGLRQENLAAEVVEVNVPDQATALSLSFLGSPTVRVDGLDIEPSARLSKDFGLMCRTYSDGGKQVGVPPLDLISAALRDAKKVQPAAHNRQEKTAAPVSPESGNSKGRKFLLGAVAAAIGASLCCILPILAAVTGAGAIATGVAFEKWRPYLLGITALLLAGGAFFAWRDHKRACAPGSLCATKPMSRWNYGALAVLAAGVIALAAFPYYSGAVARMVVRQPATSSTRSVTLSTVTFRVPDMDCPACAVSLSATLRQLPGVADAKLDVSSRQAVVTYDPGIQNVAALEKVINGAGFHIAPRPRSS
jgi:mercuric ion transport protein